MRLDTMQKELREFHQAKDYYEVKIDIIVIINYGCGNLRSIQKSIEKFYPNVIISRDLKLIMNTKGIILPGVGSFGDAVNELKNLGLFNPLKDLIKIVPTLGICLGMQLLFSNSEESSDVQGLDIIPGKVIKLNRNEFIRIPHTGWNRLIPSSEPYFYGYGYFNHSYYCKPLDSKLIISHVNHGGSVPVIIIKENIIGTQFHPEKSKEAGDEVIKYFISLIHG